MALLYLIAAGYLFVLPGYAAAGWFGRDLTTAERLAVAAGLSTALYPVLFVWLWFAGLPAAPWAVWAPGASGALALLWTVRRGRGFSDAGSGTERAAVIALALTAVVIAGTRAWAAYPMAAPAWGDSLQHTLIVQLILEHNGLFQSWLPYAPLETFTYHAGLHVNLAVWAFATGLPADRAVLWGGQLFNLFGVTAVYPLAYRLSNRNAWAGVAAVAVAGLALTMPGYYINWGRYTQLAAQVMLPILLWAFHRLWCEAPRQPPALAPLGALTVLAAGLVLTHYRVAMVAGAAGAAWFLWSLWLGRGAWPRWLRSTLGIGAAATVAGLLALPWIARLGQGRLTTLAGAMSAPPGSAAAQHELILWHSIDHYYPYWLLAAVALAALWALWRAPQPAVPLALWAAFTFLIANPGLAGIHGTGLVSNFLVMLGLYIPFAVVLGWALAEGGNRLVGRSPTPGAARVVLVVVVCGLGAWGAWRQANIVDPFHELVAAQDLDAMAWIEEHVEPDAHFLINGFLAFSDTVVVGSDAGWWLPYYTRRSVNIYPITYTMERLAPQTDRAAIRQLVVDIQALGEHGDGLPAVLCRYGITHIYQGQRQATHALPHERLIHEPWLTGDSRFLLLYRHGAAAVWSFDRTGCG